MNYCSMTIQSRKKMYNKTVSEEELSRKFSRLMMEGKLNAAIRLRRRKFSNCIAVNRLHNALSSNEAFNGASKI